MRTAVIVAEENKRKNNRWCVVFMAKKTIDFYSCFSDGEQF